MELLCPVCQISLKKESRQGVSVDICQRCHGIWLDRGELEKIFERMSEDPVELRDELMGHEHEHSTKHTSFFKALLGPNK